METLPLSFWAALAPDNDCSGQLVIGKRGVYLIDRAETVTSFALVPWEQVVPEVNQGDTGSEVQSGA